MATHLAPPSLSLSAPLAIDTDRSLQAQVVVDLPGPGFVFDFGSQGTDGFIFFHQPILVNTHLVFHGSLFGGFLETSECHGPLGGLWGGLWGGAIPG